MPTKRAESGSVSVRVTVSGVGSLSEKIVTSTVDAPTLASRTVRVTSKPQLYSARSMRIEPAKGCEKVDVSGFADALIDSVPLQVAQQAIPLDDVKRDKLLGKIQAELDAIAALRAQIPDEADVCEPGSGCPKIGLKGITADIRDHLAKLKKKLVPKSVDRNPDAGLRESLLATNLASHKAKKAALAEIPVKGRLCE